MDRRRQPPPEADSRTERLRAALRDNLARRKAQARARRTETCTAEDAESGNDEGKDG